MTRLGNGCSFHEEFRARVSATCLTSHPEDIVERVAVTVQVEHRRKPTARSASSAPQQTADKAAEWYVLETGSPSKDMVANTRAKIECT